MASQGNNNDDFRERLAFFNVWSRHIKSFWDNKWLGVTAAKNPCDAWVYQEILWDCKPDIVVETGSARGGGALFLATVCQAMGKGEVISVDIVNEKRLEHPRIIWIVGDSVSQRVFDQIKSRCQDKIVMVILDSSHKGEHVRKELELYSPLVSKDQYLIVEDTNYEPYGDGPHKAIEEFLAGHPEFAIDNSREKFYTSHNLDGFLKRIK